MPCHFVCDLLQVWVQSGPEVAGLEVAGLDAHSGQVQLQGDGERLDRRQEALSDGLRQGIFVSQGLETLP